MRTLISCAFFEASASAALASLLLVSSGGRDQFTRALLREPNVGGSAGGRGCCCLGLIAEADDAVISRLALGARACAGDGGRAGGWRTGVGRGSLQTPLRRSSRSRAPDTWQGTMLGLTCAVRETPRSHRRSCTEEKSSGDFANSEILHVQTRTVFSPRTCAPSGCYRVAQCAASGRMRASRPRSLALPSWLSSRP